MIRKLTTLLLCLILTTISSLAQIPNNEIWYTTTDGRKLDESITEFADYLVSHTYRNGKGVFKFSRNVIRIGDPGPVGIDDDAEREEWWKSLDYHMALAFGGHTRLKSVTIPKTVTRIIDYAFSDCVNLRSITIPKNVTEIGREAFRGCTGLTSITIPNSVTEIGYEAFKDCTNLRSITIPDSVTEIFSNAFFGCTGLKSFKGKYTSSDGRCLIKDGALIAFAPAGLTSYTIPNGVTEIWGFAFSCCTNLNSITIPNSVKSIKGFSGCTGLTSITIPDSVTEIGGFAFEDCTNLTNITIPDSVTEIGGYAFEGCTNLKSITIPDSVTEIGYGAFEGCNIDQITISAVTGNIFRGCDGLDTSKVVAYTGKYASEDGRCLIKYGVLIDYIHNGAERYEIPNGVTIISDEVFKGCSSLKSITIPKSVTSIGSSAFKGCTSLTEINIPDSVTMIGWHAFSGCTNLTSINIPNNVTKIWDGTFFGCTRLTSITIPDSITLIGGSAFMGCTSLKNINIPNSEINIKPHAFDGCNIKQITINAVTGNIFRGCDELDPSKVVAYTGKYASEDGRCLIKDGVLIDIIHMGLTSYVIPENITTIGKGVFKGCSTLKEITIPNSVTMIGEGAFLDCNIERITINAVTGNIFRGCGGLDPSKVVAYTGKYASEDGRCLIKDGVLIDFILGNLTSYAIPEGVKVIYPEVFSHCYILTDITIPATVTQIGDNVFAGGSPWLSITCLSTTPPQATTLGISEEATIYVPKKSVSAYKKAEGWTKHKKQIKRIKEH